MNGSPWNRRERDARALRDISRPCRHQYDEWPEPERPVVMPRPGRTEYLAALICETFAAFDRWLWWVLVRPRIIRKRGSR